MLTIHGARHRFCDGVSRRNFLKIGALGMGGVAMPDLLRAEARAGSGRSHKAIIMIFLPGGPPHQDMFEIKTEAPSEIRGEFKAIKTNVPGVHICEQFPRMARMMDKLVVLRSIVGAKDRHESFQCFTGRLRGNEPPGGWPCIGSVLSKVYGSTDPSVPGFVGLSPKMGHVPWSRPGQAGFLGPAHAPFQPNGAGKDDMVLNGITLDRLDDRKALLASVDRFRRGVDRSGMMDGLDAYNQQAFGILTSSKLATALDLSHEDPKLVQRYGKGIAKNKDDGAPRLMGQFLIARRLIEAGARCVTLAFSRWDWHGRTFQQSREEMPMLDQGVTALVEDLHNRGLDQDVTVVVWGEFGRTPKINTTAGRDHWPRVSCGLLAGGGLRTGQAIGSTDRLGGEAKDRPVHFQEVFATLYHKLGIDVNKFTLKDLAGRPQYLIDPQYKPMPELM